MFVSAGQLVELCDWAEGISRRNLHHCLGTSLPHTFTSRTTPLHDKYADTAIGNVTGQLAVLTSSLLILFQGSKMTLLPSLFSSHTLTPTHTHTHTPTHTHTHTHTHRHTHRHTHTQTHTHTHTHTHTNTHPHTHTRTHTHTHTHTQTQSTFLFTILQILWFRKLLFRNVIA